jgi:hypothetical protein
MSNDMSRVVAFSIASQERDTLYLYDVAGHKLTPRMSWAPHTGQGPIKQNIQSARFIDKDHLLTINTDGAYVLWDVSGDVKPRYQIPKAAGKKPAFSAGGRYFALTVDGGIVIVEALTGNRAGFLEVDDHWNGLVSFDPTGHQMALVTGGQVRVWDLTKREITSDFAGGAGGHEQLDWPDENTLLVDNKMVIDVPHRVQIWTYTGNPVGTLVGDRLLYVEADQTCLLASGSVPNDEARNLVKSLQGDDLLKIQPGGTVSLDVQMAGFQQHREKVLEELKKSLTANGKQIADGSNVKLVVTVKPGDVKQLAYRTMGKGRAVQQHTVATQLTSLAYQIDGKTVWSGGGEILPTFVRSAKDESVDAAISRQISENVAGLGNARIPKYVANLPPDKIAGTSKMP